MGRLPVGLNQVNDTSARPTCARRAPRIWGMAKLERVDLEISGMHCASCVASVENALRGVPGVAAASVNLATDRATVWPRSGHGEHAGASPLLNSAELIRAVRSAGYDARVAPAAGAMSADSR